MRESKALLLALIVLTMLLAATASVYAADWRVANQSYWIKVNEFTAQDGLIHGNGSHGVIRQTGFQSGVDCWYTRPSIEVWDAATGGNLLATINGVCIDTADFVGSTRHEATLMQGWGLDHSGTTHRLNGTVVDPAAWARVTYMGSKADWGVNDSTGTAASAFQIATWELISGDGSGGANFGGGSFSAGNVSGTLLADAAGYVNLGWQAPLDWTGADSWYFHNTQDFLIYNPDRQNFPTVPEIPAGVLGPLGLTILAFVRRRMAR